MGTLEVVITVLVAMILSVYSSHILVFTLGWWRLGKPEQMTDYQPATSVSVVVAARDEGHNIQSLVHDLQSQDYPGHLLEVIIVDDHSSDETFVIAERAAKEYAEGNLRVLSLEKLGLPGSKKSAIEAGVNACKGELVVVTDADCSMGSQWIRSIVSEYEGTKGIMFSGPVSFLGDKSLGSFQEMEFLSLVGTGAGAIGAGTPIFCNGANMAFKRTAFDLVGGYQGNKEYSSGDDVFLLHKIKKRFGPAAIRFLKNREAMVITREKQGWKAFFEQRVRWASKSRGYQDVFSRTTAIAVFLVNAMLFLLLLAGIFYPFGLMVFGMAFLFKLLIDFPMMAGITAFSKRRSLMFWFVPFEAVYIFYVMITGVAGLFYRGTWKGRPVKI